MKHRKLLSFVMLVLMLLTAFSLPVKAQTAASFRTKPGGKICIDGSSAVWASYTGGSRDIYQLDTSTDVETRITTDPNTQSNPSVWQKYIVWQDNRNHAGDPVTSYDIYLYDMDTKTETKISNVPGDHQNPVISNNKVVWVNYVNGKRQVMMYDIPSGSLQKVSSEDTQAFGLVFDGQIAAWMDSRGKNFDIYMYDVTKGTEKQVTYGLGDEVDPLVSGGKIAWMVNYNGVSQVYMYDTASDLTTKLTVGTENHRPLAFSGNTMVIEEGSRLVVNSVDRITEQPLKAPAGITPTQVFLQGSNILWFDGQSLVQETLTAAADRAVTGDNTPVAPVVPVVPSFSSGSSTSDTITDQNKKLVKAAEDTVITSDDGKMSLKISKGTFEKDTYIDLYQEGQIDKEGYTPVTPSYRWEIEDGLKPSIPMELTISYKDSNSGSDDKKICIYSITQDAALRPILANRNNRDETLAARVSGNGKAALAIYSRKFNDTDKHWAYGMIDVIASHQIINGYQDGSFKPDHQMTRAEFVKILVSSLAQEELESTAASESSFKDVTGDYWAKAYINIAYKKGWVSGYNGNFNPNEPITREQMITILMRMLKDVDKEGAIKPELTTDMNTYNDSSKVSVWAQDSMVKALKCGIIQGNNNELMPLKNSSRAEAVTMLYRYLEKLGEL